MAINSETLEKRISIGSAEAYVVTLDIQSFTNPETYDPSVEPGTTAGDKYVDTLLGISILGLENGDSLQAEYDHLGNEFNITANDGTAAASDVGEVRILIVGNPSA